MTRYFSIIFLSLSLSSCVVYQPLVSQFSKPPVKYLLVSPEQEKIEELSMHTVTAQSPIIDLFKSDFENLEPYDKVLLYFNLTTPLGLLDPFEAPDQKVDVKAVSNFIYGQTASQYNLTYTQGELIINSLLSYANEEFDESEFFNKNQTDLNQLVLDINSKPDVYLIGDYGSRLFRFNNYFGDASKEKTWKLPHGTDTFYDYSNLTFLEETTVIAEFDENSTELMNMIKNSQGILQLMLKLEVESVYQCQDKTIFIQAGAANNAYGFIHNAQSAEEVNCGYLADRFRIDKSTRLSDDWIFWIGK